MKWSYGVTTVPKRFPDLLPRTLKSLAAAGFDRPRLFIDGMPREAVPEILHPYDKTFRLEVIRTFGNWILTAWELYLRDPHADLYAVFQDDFVTYLNLRQYLENCTYPKQGYWNLYTFPHNEKPQQGWYPSNQLGHGAVALIFNHETLRRLLASAYMVDRPLSATRGHCYVDGGIVTALKKEGWLEYVHNPSLVQHTGEHSSMGNKHQPLARTFKGEDFDAVKLIEEPRPLPVSSPSIAAVPKEHVRIGLVGYNCNTGLGELNRQLAEYCEIDTWLIKPHPQVAPSTNPTDKIDCIVCPQGSVGKMDKFIKQVDTIVFCEQPFYKELVPMAKKHNKRLVCVPMMEWMPAKAEGWPQEVDLFLCPTQQCYDLFKDIVPCHYFPWPVDVSRYQFHQRTICGKFLFIAGHGGYKGRKGIAVIQEALRLWPDMPLVVRSQAASQWPSGVEVLPSPATNAELYSQGDVLIAPHSVDGLGLEPMEAMVCGIPVISTDGLPWNEIPAIGKIPATIKRQVIRRPVDWYVPDARALVEICRGLLGEDITNCSLESRQWAEQRAWNLFSAEFMELVRNG